jgi:hypothetical protein
MKSTLSILIALSALGLEVTAARLPSGCASEPTVTSASSANCVLTETVRTTLGVKDGCAFDCNTETPFIMDQVLTTPCGCTEIEDLVVETVSVCAEFSPCWDGYTFFPFRTTAENCEGTPISTPTSTPY